MIIIIIIIIIIVIIIIIIEHDLESADKWYEHQPPSVSESNTYKILSDFNIHCLHCDHVVEHIRPDLILIDKVKRTSLITEIAIPGDNRVGEKQLEKITKYQYVGLKKSLSFTSSCWRIGECIKKTKGIFGKDWYSNIGGKITKKLPYLG